MRGISFVINNAEALFLHLQALMDVKLYDWYIDDVELNYVPFRAGKYGGAEFKDALEGISSLSFARVRRYPIGASAKDVDEYRDYVESDCDLLLLYFDGGFFEIYTKDKNLIRAIFNFGTENGFEDLEYIDDATDARCWMHF